MIEESNLEQRELAYEAIKRLLIEAYEKKVRHTPVLQKSALLRGYLAALDDSFKVIDQVLEGRVQIDITAVEK